ncbi:erythromycin esterase family protein [Variovorax sp. EBFNA2]|uniref:erythromycin esterase family protein n=1 Tax=Variovorax sp. EBFNA2 TaxID=3342097 RepID=UPI0029C01401|nr:erythromycin esterase family protein [Variovorax boronicumulans]WPG38873.1 erythromycin esterase family protein [Variovorax boronicumulans]
MTSTPTTRQLDTLRSAAHRLDGTARDHDALLELIGDAHFVLLGEASHGTHEFYRERAAITRRLIAEKGFHAVAIEGDWPDAYRVNRFVRGTGNDASARDALAGFKRFPTWMWRNTDVVDFVEWQRAFNDARPPHQRTGFYGLDLYSLMASMEAVLGYFDRTDAEAARRARERYACFDRFGDDSQVYGLMTGLGSSPSCEQEVIRMLTEMRHHAIAAASGGSAVDTDDAFNAEQNARLVKNAEAYYRSMYLRDVSSWNLRDRHMVETLDELERHLGRGGERPRIVVWAHNSHLGDARATEMGGRRGELNVGQLMRERHGRDAVLIGFTTHAGTVTAASDWGAAAERKQVVPSRADSYEGLLHATGIDRFMLPMRGAGGHVAVLRESRLERAIGVIYRPDTERQSHYFFAELPAQFDAVLHFDQSRAVEPLEREAGWTDAEAPETYPFGM